MTELTNTDLSLLKNKGISEKKVRNQIETFKEGIPFVALEKAAVVGDGIHKFSKKEEENLIEYYTSFYKDLNILKFVPASGAASRMFKALFTFVFP